MIGMTCRKMLYAVATVLLFCVEGWAQRYEIGQVDARRYELTSAWDVFPDSAALRVLAPYSRAVDSIMSPVLGECEDEMWVARPESPLSNFLADVLLDASARVGKKADIGLCNIGGIRSALPKGVITYGNVLDVCPFESKMCILSLTGKTLMELFRQIAERGGEGLSGARLVISPDGKLLSAEVGGRPVDEGKDYTVATIDYLAEGNDRMAAFREAKSKTFPPEPLLLRTVFLDYVKECERKGRFVDAPAGGRITVAKSENK